MQPRLSVTYLCMHAIAIHRLFYHLNHAQALWDNNNQDELENAHNFPNYCTMPFLCIPKHKQCWEEQTLNIDQK